MQGKSINDQRFRFHSYSYCWMFVTLVHEWTGRGFGSLRDSLRSVWHSVLPITSDNASNADNVTPCWDISTAASLKFNRKASTGSINFLCQSPWITYFYHYWNRLRPTYDHKASSYPHVVPNRPECIAVTRQPGVLIYRARLTSSSGLIIPVHKLLFSSPTRITHSWCKVFAPVLWGLSAGIVGIVGNHRGRNKQAMIQHIFCELGKPPS